MSVLFEALAVAAGGLFSFGSILIVLMLLSSPQGLAKAAAYYLGYFGAYLVIGWVMIGVGAGLRPEGGGSPASAPVAAWISFGVGVLLLVLGVLTMRRAKDAPPRMPAWLAKLDQTSAARVLGLGATVTVLNFKNLAIYVSAIAVVMQGGLATAEAAAAVVPVAFLFCLGVLSPVVLFAVFSRQVAPRLQAVRRRLHAGNRRFTMVVLLALGAIFVARGLVGVL